MEEKILSLVKQWSQSYIGIIKMMIHENCIYKKCAIVNNELYIYFDVPNSMPEEQLRSFSEAFNELTDVTLKYKRV